MQPSWLPPNQMPTESFQITGEREAPPEALDEENWQLVITGLVKTPLTLTLTDVQNLSTRYLETDIHCVTGWSYRAMRFTGFPLEILLDLVGPTPKAKYVWFGAYSPRDHDTSLPLDLAREDTWLVTHANGAPLEPSHGYPLRTVTPSRYFYKSLKWIHRIELLSEDRLGFWERTSRYHNNGNPWQGNERYESGVMKRAQVIRFIEAVSYDWYREKNRMLISVDLSGWRPVTMDLHGLQLKNCNLRKAELSGADLRGANLSNSVLRNAELCGADLRGADLEGVDFSGADLRDTDFRDAILTVARFCDVSGDGRTTGARVTGMRWDGTVGLFPEQEAYLENQNRNRFRPLVGD